MCAAGRALRASPGLAVQRQPRSGKAAAAPPVPCGSEEKSWLRGSSSAKSWGCSGCGIAPLPARGSQGWGTRCRQVSAPGLLLTLFKVMFLFRALKRYLQQKPIILTRLNLSRAARCRGSILHSRSNIYMLMVCGLGRKLPEMHNKFEDKVHNKFEDKVAVQCESFLGSISFSLLNSFPSI